MWCLCFLKLFADSRSSITHCKLVRDGAVRGAEGATSGADWSFPAAKCPLYLELLCAGRGNAHPVCMSMISDPAHESK